MELKTALAQAAADLAASESAAKKTEQELERLRLYDEGVAAALDAGMPNLYLRLRAEKETIEQGLPSLCADVDETGTDITPELLERLWRKYAESKNADTRADLTEYRALIHKAFGIFERMMQRQDDSLELEYQTALTILRLRGLYTSIPNDSDLAKMSLAHEYAALGLGGLELVPKRAEHVVHVDNAWAYPDAAFFVCSGEMSANRLGWCTRVAERQLSAPRK